ncbi:9980_t:CDS:2, partial [Entrophospora sp. SA101]
MNCLYYSFEDSSTSAHSDKECQIPVKIKYNFGGSDGDSTGVFELPPRMGPPNVTYKDSILIGYTKYDKEEIKNIIQELSKEWKGNTYRLLTRNCNHFTNELCLRLVGKATPSVVPTSGWIDPPESEANDLETKSKLNSANIYTLLSASPFSTPPSTPSSETSYKSFNMLNQIIKKETKPTKTP